MQQQRLDALFPTFVRYTGVALAILLVVAAVLGKGGTSIASGGVLALGMILYKTVHEAANGGGGGGGGGSGG